MIDCLATSYSHRGKPPTTIGAKELNYCVRDGNRCILFAIVTKRFFDAILLVSCVFRCCLIVSIVTYHKYAPQSTQSRLEILRFISEFISLAWII